MSIKHLFIVLLVSCGQKVESSVSTPQGVCKTQVSNGSDFQESVTLLSTSTFHSDVEHILQSDISIVENKDLLDKRIRRNLYHNKVMDDESENWFNQEKFAIYYSIQVLVASDLSLFIYT